MRYTVNTGRLIDATSDIGIIVLPENQNLDGLDPAIAQQIQKHVGLGDFTGEAKTSTLLYTSGNIKIPRLLLVGSGKLEDLDIEGVRQTYAGAAKKVSEMGLKSATIPLLATATPDEIRAAAEAIPLSLYQFNPYKTKISDADEKKLKLQSVTFLTEDEDAERKAMIESAVRRGEIYANACILARDLSNEPGNHLTPAKLAEQAESIAAESGLKCEVFNKAMLEKKGFGAMLAVSQGSAQEPRFIILDYVPEGSESKGTVVLVGKAITFDTGGINLKSQFLPEMKHDMSGGASVLAALRAINELKPDVRVIGLIAASENMPGSSALKPSDVIRSYSGKKIEILNTDAEGRLVLADALAYAKKYEPDAVVDQATLTGAVVYALGKYAAGAMGTDNQLMEKVKSAAIKTHERVAELPLWADYEDDVKSTIADIKNLGDGINAGSIAGAAFLKFFVDDCYPWVHIDIAGVAWNMKSAYTPEHGASGWGARLLVQLVEDWE